MYVRSHSQQRWVTALEYAGDEFLLMLIELRRVDVESCKERAFDPTSIAQTCVVTAPPHSPACRAGWQPRGDGGRRAPRW
jgi:hypothetical protein